MSHLSVSVRHDDRSSLEHLAVALAALSESEITAVLADLVLAGILVVRDPTAANADIPTLLRAAGIEESAHHDATKAFLTGVDGIADTLLSTLLNHLVAGQDQRDLRSAGGFDRPFLVDLARIVSQRSCLTVVVEAAAERRTGAELRGDTTVRGATGTIRPVDEGRPALVGLAPAASPLRH